MGIAEFIMIATLALSIVTGTLQQNAALTAASYRGKIGELAKELASKLSQNQVLKEKFINAWNERNSRQLTSLMYGMGFGARAESLRADIRSNKMAYDEAMKYYNDRSIRLEAGINDLNTASNSVTGYGSKTEVEDKISNAEKINKEIGQTDDLSQNIKGGAI